MARMKRTRCEECGGNIAVRSVDYEYLGEHIGKFPAEVCRKCGEVAFDEKASGEIENKVKQKGLYGLGAVTKVGVAGSSPVIRMTKKLANFLKLQKGQEVHIHPETRDRIIIETSR